MTACCVQKVPNVRFPHFLLSAFPMILFMLVRSGRDVISSLVTLRLAPHDITARYNAATFFSSFLIARLMKSLMVMPVEATNAATRECNSDGIRRFSLPL